MHPGGRIARDRGDVEEGHQQQGQTDHLPSRHACFQHGEGGPHPEKQ